MPKKILGFLTVCLLMLSITLGGCTTMQDMTVTTNKKKYPDKPINLIVPFGAGAGIDLVARMLEKEAPSHLGQPFIILNKPGATGTVGWNEVVNATPDGYTLCMTGIEVILQSLYGPTKYNYPTALDPLVQIADLSMVMAVQADQPWENLNDLIAYANQHPGQLKFGHAGIGGIGHITGEIFAKKANIEIEQVPFQSGAEVTANLLGKHVQIIFVNPASIKEHVKNGTVKILAVAGEQRLVDPIFVNTPTFQEQGFDVLGSNWYGIAAPKDLPPDIRNKLTESLKAMINDPEFKRNMENSGLQVNYLGPKETENKWLAERQRLVTAVQETGIIQKIENQKK